MNDRNKFRVWQVKRKLYTNERNMAIDMNGDLYDCKHGLSPVSMDTHVVEWCACRKDNRGDLIFAGDIVRSGMTGAVYAICWSDENSAWYKQMINANVNDRPIFQDSTSQRIIGNIHENGDLLK